MSPFFPLLAIDWTMKETIIPVIFSWEPHPPGRGTTIVVELTFVGVVLWFSLHLCCLNEWLVCLGLFCGFPINFESCAP